MIQSGNWQEFTWMELKFSIAEPRVPEETNLQPRGRSVQKIGPNKGVRNRKPLV